ncbi:MAG: trehalose-6-phosphate synthase, partial [Deltaproteobacteria bacterium]|nr:trehalose-6-phosphate synthase [Deltaproteobacteria bacterium]
MVWTEESLREAVRSQIGKALFVVVSNREPYLHIFREDRIEWQRPASGMVTALDPVLRACGGLWVAHGSGNADKEVVDEWDRVGVPPERPLYTLKRVWLTKEEEDGYYHGFANETLWPLCHVVFARPTFDPSDWRYYQKVNERFAQAVLAEIGEQKAFV